MSDIESYESFIEYEGFEYPGLAYIEENRQERARDLEDAQMHDDYVEMLMEVRETEMLIAMSERGHDKSAPDYLETLSKGLNKTLADFEKKRDETLPGTIADLERKRDEALAEYERKRDEALDDEALDDWERKRDEALAENE